MNTKMQEDRALVQAMEDKRNERLATWRLIQRYILPMRGKFAGENAATARELAAKRLSTAGTRAIRLTAAGLTSSMTPENMRWYRLDPRDQRVLERPYVREWLDATENVINASFVAGGFYSAIHNLNTDLPGFGSALFFIDSDPETFVRFEDCTAGTFAVSLDAKKDLDAVCRRITMTAKALMEKYGDKVSDHVRTLASDPATALTEVEIVHLVTRNADAKPGKLDRNSRPWRHVVYEQNDTKGYLLQSGYYEMPYMFVTWDSSHHVYGSGPGDDALADVMQACELKRLNLTSANMRVNPPLSVPASYQGRLNIHPGGINRHNGLDSDGVRPLLNGIAYDSSESRAELMATEKELGASLMSTIFETIPMGDRPPGMTATEFLGRKQERLLTLGPAVSRYMTALRGMLIRTHAILGRAGQLPPPPPTITDPGVLDVAYTSPMSQAMRAHSIESTMAVVDTVRSLAQMDQSVMDKLNMDQTIDVIARDIGAPGGIIRSDEETAQVRQQKQAAQQAMMEAERARQASEIAVKAAAVPTSGTMMGNVAEMLGLPPGKDGADANAEQKDGGNAQ